MQNIIVVEGIYWKSEMGMTTLSFKHNYLLHPELKDIPQRNIRRLQIIKLIHLQRRKLTTIFIDIECLLVLERIFHAIKTPYRLP